MHRLLAALFATALVGLAAPPLAGGYVSLGVGTDADLGGTIGDHFTSDGHRAGRLAIGQRFGDLAIEATLYGTGVSGTSRMTGDGDFNTATAGIALKYYIGLIGPLEAYGRAGLNKTWLIDRGNARDLGYSGRGYDFGGGLQYTFGLSHLGAAIWLDYNHQRLELAEDGMPTLKGSTNLLILGMSLSF